MKRAMAVLAVVLSAVVFLLPGYAAGTRTRKLTVMVYMCGSNLESEYGSATADILEMKSAGFSDDDTAVLVMMGGSGSWQLTPGLSETVIMAVGPNRHRIVWRSEQKNMGDQETLTRLLKFGKEEYPADDYALILWNHGGGPLEGVCWDELFSMDHLSLKELSEGIRNAWMPGKLSWIGFDACLMGSAEVAAAVAPYAEYMIASEETEPAAGWNYAFLKDADGDGAKTGRRIVDCYFEALADSRDPLTMACIDLNAMDRVIRAMESFFLSIDESISEEHFADLSRIRSASSGFGKGIRAVGEEGYDLVDLADLTARYGGEDSELSKAIGEAVIYVRSDSGKAGGLSVYHPYTNKRKFRERWRNDYRRLDFSAAYTNYIEHFGALLTSEEYVDWSRMIPSEPEVTEDGEYILRLQLTEAQARDYLSGELMIMDSARSSQKVSLAPVAVSPVTPDGAGGLTAVYRGNTLYAMDPDGKILQGPVSFQMTEGGDFYVILALYHDYSSGQDIKNDTAVLYYCTPKQDTDELEIARIYVYDRVSETYTNRIPFSEDGFNDVDFWYFIRNLPDTGKAIPAFEDWDMYQGFLARPLSLPCDWHLRFLDEWNSDELYAVFQITDIHQNRWCSVPIRIRNPRKSIIDVEESIPKTEGLEIHCSAELKATTLNPSFQIRIRVQNTSDQTFSFNGTNAILNGNRSTGEYVYLRSEPGTTEEYILYLNDEDIIGLDRITSVDFTLTASVYGDYEADPVNIPVHLELKNGELGTLSSDIPEPLDTYQDGETVWQLISMRQEADGTISGLLHVRNNGDEALQMSGMLLINGMQTGASVYVQLAPRTAAYIPYEAKDRQTISSISMRIAGSDRLYHMGVNQALEQAGIMTADRLDIYPGTDYYSEPDTPAQISLRMPEGVALQPAEKTPAPVTVFEYDGIRVLAEQILIADNGIGIGLRLENGTDRMIRLDMIDPVLDGKTYQGFDAYAGIRMPPRTRAVYCLKLSDLEDFTAGKPAEEFSFRFRIGNMVSSPVIIRFPAGTVLGAEGGTLLHVGESDVTAAEMEDKPMVLNETADVSVDAIRPIRVTAPLTPGEAEMLESGSVSFSLISYEKSLIEDTPEQIATRSLILTGLQKNGNEWAAQTSGLVAVVQGHPLRTRETQLTDNSWQLEPDSIYLYPEAGICQYAASQNTLFFEGTEFLYSQISLTAEYTSGQTVISDKQMNLSTLSSIYYSDARTNRYLEEIAEACMETRVFFGSDRLANAFTIDYYERQMLTLEEPVTVQLVPLEKIEGRKCLYYTLFFTDGTRKDILIDPETGTVLDQTLTPAD